MMFSLRSGPIFLAAPGPVIMAWMAVSPCLSLLVYDAERKGSFRRPPRLSSGWHHLGSSRRERERMLWGLFLLLLLFGTTGCALISSLSLFLTHLPGLTTVSQRFLPVMINEQLRRAEEKEELRKMKREEPCKSLHRKISDQKHSKGSLDAGKNKDTVNSSEVRGDA